MPLLAERKWSVSLTFEGFQRSGDGIRHVAMTFLHAWVTVSGQLYGWDIHLLLKQLV
jgi:hypothetical protein